MTNLIAKKANGFTFNHPQGKLIGNGWGVYNTENNTFLTFDGISPYVPSGGKRTAQEVAATIDQSNCKFVRPL